MFNHSLTFYRFLNFYRVSHNLNFVFNNTVLLVIPKLNILLGFGSCAVV